MHSNDLPLCVRFDYKPVQFWEQIKFSLWPNPLIVGLTVFAEFFYQLFPEYRQLLGNNFTPHGYRIIVRLAEDAFIFQSLC